MSHYQRKRLAPSDYEELRALRDDEGHEVWSDHELAYADAAYLGEAEKTRIEYVQSAKENIKNGAKYMSFGEFLRVSGMKHFDDGSIYDYFRLLDRIGGYASLAPTTIGLQAARENEYSTCREFVEEAYDPGGVHQKYLLAPAEEYWHEELKAWVRPTRDSPPRDDSSDLV